MDSIQKLTELFRKFPGIGPRQARRFAFFLLSKDVAYNRALGKLILEVKNDVQDCVECHRFVSKDKLKSGLCGICSDPKRDFSILTIVSGDADLDALEKSGSYKGTYFVLGGNLPILEKVPQDKIRLNELTAHLDKKTKNALAEVILALSANPEGEHTEEFLIATFGTTLKKAGVRLTRLGRGLSTGTELEYADPDTLMNALKHRG